MTIPAPFGDRSRLTVNQPHLHCLLPQPIGLRPGDAGFARYLRRVQPQLEELDDAVEIAEVEGAPVPTRDAERVDVQARLDRVCRLAVEIARLLEMELEACAFGR